MNSFQDPTKSLGERCTLFCENEMANNVHETFPNSFTSPRIAEYLSICTRNVNGKEVPIGISKGNWCSASQCFALKNCLIGDEIAPHGYRVGVVEVVSDLTKNNRYHTIAEARAGTYQPKRGDLVIWDRSTPGKPETAWYRHILRITTVNADGFTCISGNSGGKWSVSQHKLSQANLLGFGSYPSLLESVEEGIGEIADWSQVPVESLAPMESPGPSFADLYHGVTGR